MKHPYELQHANNYHSKNFSNSSQLKKYYEKIWK
jgi:hypothetical protein